MAKETFTLKVFTNGGRKMLAHYTNLSQSQVNKIITGISEGDAGLDVVLKVY